MTHPHQLSTSFRHRRNANVTTFTIGVLVVVFLIVAGILVLFSRGADDSEVVTITEAATRGPFIHEVLERGEIESSSNVEIRCEVKSRNSGGTAILEVVSEGTWVEESDVLVRLDSSALEQDLVQQQIVSNTSEALLIQAQNEFEAAQIARQEYIEGTYHQTEQEILGEILLAEENLRRATQNAKHSERLAAKGYVTALQLEGDKFAVREAESNLLTGRTKLRVLQEYTKRKTLKELDSNIKTSEAKWKSEQSSHQLELDKLKDIEEQIKKCVIVAPQSGQVVHANRQSSRSQGEFIVEPGALVRERQAIIRLPDPKQMQVKAKINEARVTLVKQGMPVQIRLDAFGDQALSGEVVHVNEYPEPTSWFGSQVKEYATFIKIFDPPANIRPGLTAEARITVNRLDDVLKIPVQGLYEHGSDLYCMLQTANGWDAKPVEIGATNDKFAVIKNGLDAGDTVSLDPRKLVSEVDLPEIVESVEETVVAENRANENRDSAESGAKPPVVAQRGPGGGEARNGGADGRTGRSVDGPSRGPGGGGGGPPNPSMIVQMIFSRFDKDGDGAISKGEVPTGQAGRMSGADADGDGMVTRAEMTAAIAKRMGQGGGPPSSSGGSGE